MLSRITAFALLICLAGCTKMDDYLQHTDGKEIAYAGKADKPTVFTGRNRIKISYFLRPDPKITKGKIFWRNRLDSVEFAIERKGSIDTVQQTITLPEGSYSFEIVNYHESGVKSVPTFISGRVYGSNYEKTLINRGIASFSNVANNGVKIDWGVNENTAYGVNLEYSDLLDKKMLVAVPVKSTTNTLLNVKNKSFVYYKTSFKPDSTSMDTFYSLKDSLFINR